MWASVAFQLTAVYSTTYNTTSIYRSVKRLVHLIRIHIHIQLRTLGHTTLLQYARCEMLVWRHHWSNKYDDQKRIKLLAKNETKDRKKDQSERTVKRKSQSISALISLQIFFPSMFTARIEPPSHWQHIGVSVGLCITWIHNLLALTQGKKKRKKRNKPFCRYAYDICICK